MLVFARPSACLVCAAPLMPWLEDVEDRVYGVAGAWRYTRCVGPDCGTVHLDHDLTADQLAGFYAAYSTHSAPVLTASGIKRLYRDALGSIQHELLGYATHPGNAARLAGKVLSAVPFFRQNALARLFWLPAKPCGRVVEVGYGNGQGLATLRAAGWEVIGCEFDAECINAAREKGFEVYSGGLDDARLPAASVDAVVASHLVEHVPDPTAFVREAARILRPGGRLVLLTPNAAGHDAVRFGRDWRGLEPPRHLTVHTPSSLHRMATAAGFGEISVFGTALGGFIMQQTRELAAGEVPSPQQGRKTVRYHFAAGLRNALDDLASDEIVMQCRLPS